MGGNSILRNKTFHKKYMKWTGFFVGSFGPICFLATIPGFEEPARYTLDLLSWPVDGAQSFSDPTLRFVSAIFGGFLFGFGVTIWCLSHYVYDKAPEMVRRSVLIGLCSWFVLDSTGSVLSGNASNALFNIAVILLFAGPLWFKAEEQSNHG